MTASRVHPDFPLREVPRRLLVRKAKQTLSPHLLQHGLSLSHMHMVSSASDSRKSGKLRARHTFRGWFFGTTSGVITFIALYSSCLILGFAGLWVALPPCDNCDYSNEWSQAIWLAWGIFFDPGTQTGLPASEDAGHGHKIAAAVFSVAGFVFNLGVLGLVVEQIRRLVSRFRAHHLAVVANDHIVVLGWTDKTLFLLEELAQMLTDGEEGRGQVLVLADLEVEEMRSEVKVTYPDWKSRFPRVRLRFMRGKPYEIDDLMRVSVFAARHVMVLGMSRSPREADSQVITMLCALRCLPVRLSPDCLVIAELRQAQTKSVARQLGGQGEGANKILPVAAAQAIDALLVLCALSPSAGQAMMDLMSFNGNQIEIVPAKGTPLAGCTFGAARRAFGNAVLVGLIKSDAAGQPFIAACPPPAAPLREETEAEAGAEASVEAGAEVGAEPEVGANAGANAAPAASGPLVSAGGGGAATARGAHEHHEPHEDGLEEEAGVHKMDSVYRDRERVRLAPPDDTIIHAADLLVVVAMDLADACKGLRAPPPAPPRTAMPSPAAATTSAFESARRGVSSVATAAMAAVHRKAADAPGLAAPEAAAASVPAALARQPTAGPVTPPPKVVLLVGWSTSLGSLLRAFDARLPPGSELCILSERDLVQRRRDMEADGLALDGSAASREEYAGGDAARTAQQLGAACGLRHLTVRHVVGFVTDYLALRRLPVCRAHFAVIIVSSKEQSGSFDRLAESQIADSEAMTAAILLRRLRDEAAAAAVKRYAVKPPPLQVVAQLADVLTRRLLETQPELLNTSLPECASNCVPTLVIHRNYMETTTLSVAANNAAAWSALRALVYPGGGADLSAIPVTSVIAPGELTPIHAFAAEAPDSHGHRRISDLFHGLGHSLGQGFHHGHGHGEGVGGGNGDHAPPPPPLVSFSELAERVRAHDLGVLVGWRRAPRGQHEAHEASHHHISKKSVGPRPSCGGGGSFELHGLRPSVAARVERAVGLIERGLTREMGPIELNPLDKQSAIPWCATDLLLVIQQDSRHETSTADYGSVEADLFEGSEHTEFHR